MPFWIRDFEGDDVVDVMPTLAVGAYLRILLKAWYQRPVGTVPNDEQILRQWARVSDDQWAEIRVHVLACFKLQKDGRLHQKRMKAEYQKLVENRREKTLAGKKAATAKWDRYRELHANALRPHNDRYAYSESESDSKTEEKTNTVPLASANGAAAPPDPVPKRRKPRDPTQAGSLQARVIEDVWKPKWSAAHYGADYAPARSDYVQMAEIMKRLGKTATGETHAIERFGRIADVALAQPEEFGWEGHPLSKIAAKLSFLIGEVTKQEKGIANGKLKHANSDRTLVEGLRL